MGVEILGVDEWIVSMIKAMYEDASKMRRAIKRKIYKACVQSALTYGTETWAVKKANLQSLERKERMMVRWMCGVSLKDNKCSVDLYSLLGVQSVDEVGGEAG